MRLEEWALWGRNKVSHARNKVAILCMLRRRRTSLLTKERALATTYRTKHAAWQKELAVSVCRVFIPSITI